MRITTNNGTTISGSLSEVLATLTHLGVTAEPVTTTEVTETAVTDGAGDGYTVALAPKGSYLPISYGEMEAQLAKIHADDAVATPKLTRDGVIQQAIDDVKALLSREYYGYFSTIVSLIENPQPVKYPGSAHKNDKLPGWNASSQVTLINDSARHTAPDLEVSRIIRH